jgi:hypothetical protein
MIFVPMRTRYKGVNTQGLVMFFYTRKNCCVETLIGNVSHHSGWDISISSHAYRSYYGS